MTETTPSAHPAQIGAPESRRNQSVQGVFAMDPQAPGAGQCSHGPTDAGGILPRIIIGWPVAALWRNRKAHWAAEKRSRDAQRHEAWGSAKAAGWTRAPDGTCEVIVTLTFCPPSRTSRFDLDGALSACKGLLDGLAQGLGVDDAIFVPVLRRGDKCKNGGVIVDARIVGGGAE